MAPSFEALTQEQKLALIKRLGSVRADTRLAKIEHALNHRTRHLTVVLEDIYQEQNASAVLRSCDCFGLQDIHVIEKKHRFSVHQNISMGSNRWLDVHTHKQNKDDPNDATRTALQWLKQRGYQIAASTLRDDAISLNEMPIEQPLAILIGHELKGLSQAAHEEADIWFQLPMHGFTQSHNLSVFCALCLYDLTNRLRKSQTPWQLSDEEKIDLRLQWLSEDSAQAPVILKEFFDTL